MRCNKELALSWGHPFSQGWWLLRSPEFPLPALTLMKQAHKTLQSRGFVALTQQVQHQVLAGGQRVLQVEEGVAAVLDLPQRLKVPQQDVTEPLRVHARDPPLLGLLVFQPTGPWRTGKEKNKFVLQRDR